MIKLTNINKYYHTGSESYHALKDINLTLPNQGLVFIVGKSGSGKSTLLNIIGGIDSYDSGDLIIDNLNTNTFSRKNFNSYRNTYVGFIFQEFNVVKNLTVYENIALSLQLKNESLKENHDLILQAIAEVGLTGKEKRKMNQLSGGERQRVAIARALVKKPKIVIADEPTGNLDKHNRDVVMDILKKIAQDHLVVVVTHDRDLANKYSSQSITLKDGEIINNSIVIPSDSSSNSCENIIEPIKPTIKTSFYLSMKSLKQNLMRFIFIVLFFTISLVFANATINLYFSNALNEYANYQNDYQNHYLTISQTEKIYNNEVKTGFFQLDTVSYQDLINSFNIDDSLDNFNIYKVIKNPIKFNEFLKVNEDNFTPFSSSLYSDQIDNFIVLTEDNPLNDKISANTTNDYICLNDDYTVPSHDQSIQLIKCYITDYLADAIFNYAVHYGIVSEVTDNGEDLEYKPYLQTRNNYLKNLILYLDNLNCSFYFGGIFVTNFDYFKDADLTSPNVLTSLIDNMAFYNSLFIPSSYYVANNDAKAQVVSTYNMKTTTDDFIFNALNNNGIIEDVKVTSFDNNLPLVKGTAPVHKIDENDLERIAVSTGFLAQICDYDLDDLRIENYESGKMALYNPKTNTPATFSLYGYRRILTSFSCQVVGIVEDENPTIYFCNPNESDMYYNYLKTSFADFDGFANFGGYIVVEITNDPNRNIALYQALRNQNIVIDNLSYIKLQVVSDFIDHNLVLFLSIFFALLLFSILMIFNFVITTIKNTTRDIGIYMSLGMNGFKIACIYLFQILLVSIIAFIISMIGAAIFLQVLDNSLGSNAASLINETYHLEMAPINFKTFNFTFLGVILALVIAFLVPIISVIIPLFNLARKKPIDVLKEA